MKKLIFISIMVMVFGCTSKNENPLNVSKQDYKQASKAFAELKDALISEDGKLWNYKLDGPLLLINSETRLIIANEPDTKGELVKFKDFYVGNFPENMNIANSAIDWNGKRWTMVMLPLPYSKEDRVSLLIHESFHRIQPEIGFNSIKGSESNHLDTKDGRIFLKLEMEALKAALSSENPKNHIQNALLFRQYRYQLFPNAKQSENYLEIFEGLAEYTGSILSGRSINDLQKYYGNRIDEFYSMPTFVRSFAYYTIPVYGFFMQQSDKTWNQKININSNLTDFILEYFKVKNMNPTKEEIVQLGKLYNMDEITSFEQDRETRQLKQINKYRATFLGDSIIKIKLENMSFGYNPCNLVPLDTFGMVYPNIRVTDNWGILEVDSCGALLTDWKYITISYPETITDNLISGKGWKLKLNDSWKLERTSISYTLSKK